MFGMLYKYIYKIWQPMEINSSSDVRSTTGVICLDSSIKWFTYGFYD